MQMIMFMKNLSMLGGAFLISHFGAGRSASTPGAQTE